jgi:hypothetical protein
MFNIIIAFINGCWNSSYCEFILSNIYYENTYIYYIIIIILLFIAIHSYIYTYVFNQNIYKDLYNLYGNNESNYKNSDLIIYNTINNINKTDINYNTISDISYFLNNLKIFSMKNISFRTFLDEKNVLVSDADAKLKKVRNESIIINNKFIIPSELENDDDTNILFKNIYKTDIKTLISGANIEKEQELLANKIFLYLIYNYVIRYNKEDPYIIHKLNNIYLHTFENLYNIHIEEDFKKHVGEPIQKTYLEIVEEGTNYALDTIIDLVTTKKENFISGVSSSPASSLPTSSAATLPTAIADKKIEKTAEEKAAEEKKEKLNKKISEYVPIDKLVLLNIFNTDIKKMYDEINNSFTIKFLLPVNITKDNLSESLHSDANLILNYIYKYNKINNTPDIDSFQKSSSNDEITIFYDDIVKETDNNRDIRIKKEDKKTDAASLDYKKKQFNKLRTNIHDKIKTFTNVFENYKQENKTLTIINTTIYKINFYLAAEMMQVIIFILLVLFMLYKSKKYPFLEKYINISIVYAILIINEVISAILGII